LGRLKIVSAGIGLVDAAGIHHHHHVGEGDRLGLGVGDVDEGNAELGLEAAQFAGACWTPEELVERRQRLVEKQHLRVGDQRAGKRDALLLAAGELGGHAVAELLELDALQHLLDSVAPLGFADAAHLEVEADVVGDGEMREERIALEHHRRAALDRRLADHHLVADEDLAGTRRLVPGDHPEDRRLAAARRAEKAAIGPVRDGQVDVLHRVRAAELLGDVDEADLSARLPGRHRGAGLRAAHCPNVTACVE
jgi:hypothetical protein